MTRKWLLPAICLAYCSAFMASAVQAGDSNLIKYGDQNVFLSGGNIAWINFGADVGPDTKSIKTYDDIFSSVEAHGGNTMRFWININGTVTPAWAGDSVSGPGTDAIKNLRAIVDDAWSHHVTLILSLWSFDMAKAQGSEYLLTAEQVKRNHLFLTQKSYTEAYINNALIPMVKSLKGNPGVMAWEVFNEPEGMTKEFSFGLPAENLVAMSDIQRTVNLIAGAIHRADPDAKVTNGVNTLQQLTDVNTPETYGKDFNYYRDDRLIAAGDDPLGTLDFYEVHYYNWAPSPTTPLNYPASHWKLGKPLILGEFFLTAGNDNGVPPKEVYQNYYDLGYAGALVWQWDDYHNNNGDLANNWLLGLDNMSAMKKHHPEAVELDEPCDCR